MKGKMKDKRCRNILLVFAVTAILACVISLNIFEVSADDETTHEQTSEAEILIFEAGHGSAYLIQIGKKNILIDGGKKEDFEYINKYLKDRKIKEFDLVLITHPHADHIGGINRILDEYKVKRFVMKEDRKCTTGVYSELINKLARKKIKIEKPAIDSALDFGSAELKILGLGTEAFATNDNSIVCKLMCGMQSFLFTGDIGEKTEKGLVMKYGESLKVSVLTVPHHGSSYSSSPEFLKMVSPNTAVVSSNKSPAVIIKNRYKDVGAVMHGTHRERTISCRVSGGEITMGHCVTPVTPVSRKERVEDNCATPTLRSTHREELYSKDKESEFNALELEFDYEEISVEPKEELRADTKISSAVQTEKLFDEELKSSSDTQMSNPIQTEEPCDKGEELHSDISRFTPMRRSEPSDTIGEPSYVVPVKIKPVF